nr:MAG TPA: hypothetical protein [Caudoviricetes sp.]
MPELILVQKSLNKAGRGSIKLVKCWNNSLS